MEKGAPKHVCAESPQTCCTAADRTAVRPSSRMKYSIGSWTEGQRITHEPVCSLRIRKWKMEIRFVVYDYENPHSLFSSPRRFHFLLRRSFFSPFHSKEIVTTTTMTTTTTTTTDDDVRFDLPRDKNLFAVASQIATYRRGGYLQPENGRNLSDNAATRRGVGKKKMNKKLIRFIVASSDTMS
ncbi:hypothetical protein V9T40_010545 [Parthenolecanium corni]|uniref:Uncharacterized protein n=1 Tax=Parthenolecanium corni TaxID=536013 RepID=A0AAN9T7C5_9HEMI